MVLSAYSMFKILQIKYNTTTLLSQSNVYFMVRKNRNEETSPYVLMWCLFH